MLGHSGQGLYQNTINRRQLSQLALYDQALARGRRGQLWSALIGQPRLLCLQDVTRTCTVQARSYEGRRLVPIAHICGSEKRSEDFDRDFNPLQDRTRDRWLSIASAMLRGHTLPPVALIQVGDRYFVQDGHHRISVARALGQKTIQATVEIWHIARPVPWRDVVASPLVGHQVAVA